MFFRLKSQCCDANDYLEYGRVCAEFGDCYDKLRPMGSVYWFSLPYKLGLPEDALIWMQLALTLLSIFTSVLAAKKAAALFSPMFRWRVQHTLLATLANTIIHAIFLYPVFWNSLSDLPASILFLIGMWSTILYLTAENRNRAVLWMVISGLCFGLSAWIRVFFLYPVVFIMVIYTVIWLVKKGPAILLPFIVAIPLLAQVLAVYAQTGAFVFTDPELAAKVKKLHMEMDAVGYDTYLAPKNSWGIPKGITTRSSCKDYQPPSEIIKTFDIYSLACIVSGRINFYFGSYGDRTYYIKNIDVFKRVDIFSDPAHVINFSTINSLQYEPIRAAFDTENKIDAFMVSKINPQKSSEAFDVLWLDEGFFYSFAMWVWHDEDSHNYLEFFIRDAETKDFISLSQYNNGSISTSQYIVSTYPNLASTLCKVEKSGFYEVGIKSLHYEPDTVIGAAAKNANIRLNTGSFYAWDPQVLVDIKDPWDPVNLNDSNLPKRIWSYWILFINMIALSIAMVVLLQITQVDKTTGVTFTTILLLVCAMCIAVVPEQRFAIAPMIAIWQLCLLGIILHGKTAASKILGRLQKLKQRSF